MSLKLENVSYLYEAGTPMETQALYPLSLEVRTGEILAVIGATGSGKSTLIQMMNGLNRPSAGRVLYDGEDIFAEKYDRRALRSRVGLVFQYPEYQLFETDVLKDVCFGPKNQGLDQEECIKRARRAMAAVGLDESYEKRSPFELSGGEKRRAAIAGVLAMEPQILILDEPTSGLDPAGRQELLAELKALRRDRGMGIVMVSHSMEDVADMADRVIVLAKGKLVREGSPREIFAEGADLEQYGLSLPSVVRVLAGLRTMGLPVRSDALSVGEAEEEILKVFSLPTEG